MANSSVLLVNKDRWGHEEAGGSETYLGEVFSRLSSNHDVTLICGDTLGENCSSQDGVDVVQPTRNDLPGTLGLLKVYFVCTLYAYYFIITRSPDVVVTVNTPLPWPVMTRRPKISIVHHLAMSEFFETHPFPLDWFGYLAQRIGISISRWGHIVTVSRSSLGTLTDYGVPEEIVTVIKNGIDIERYDVGAERSTPSMLFIGGLDTYKGADRLPDVHRRAESLFGAPIQFDIAGRGGNATDTVVDYCTETQSASYHGFVSEERKRDLLRETWLLVAPSRVEGYGIIVIEANACGTPAVGTNVRGLRDSIKDGQTGVLVEEDPEAIAEAIVRVLRDDPFRRELSTAAREWAETHSWECSAAEFDSLLTDVIEGE
jgi:glycosyltransferase involved in cell wall biosynthesis